MATRNLNLRIPEDLHRQIQQAAEKDRRSINSEVLWLIETALANRKERQ